MPVKLLTFLKRMNVFAVAGILLFAFFLSTVNGFSLPGKTGAFNETGTGSFFNAHSDIPPAEIEHCIQQCNPISSHHGFQYIFGFVSGQLKHPEASPAVNCKISFPYIERFGNNSLVHNYPSHKFW